MPKSRLSSGSVTEGTRSVIMKDGKPVGGESSGKALFEFGSDTLAALSRKLARFETKPMGVGRFGIDVTTDGAAGTVGTSLQ